MRKTLYQVFRNCTVRLKTSRDSGTGFFIAPGQVLTCKHVVREKAQIYWQGKTFKPIDVKIQEDVDLALLQIDFTDHPCVYLDEEATPGDRFYSYGYPDQTKDGGSITVEFEGTAHGEQLFTLKDENIRPGFSGAPLLNQSTLKVCGLIKSERLLVTEQVRRALGGYAIPLNVILKYWPRLKQENHDFHHKAQLPPQSGSSLRSLKTPLMDSRHIITRNTWVNLMNSALSQPPKWSETEILKNFKIASNIGREWLRKIDGKTIRRVEFKQIVQLIIQGSRTILLTDRPGSGKTCVLLKLADLLERTSSPCGLLFIKGDYFDKADNEQDLVARGLPEDIVGRCAHLAEFRRVVVVIDSLDVLSLNRQHRTLKLFLSMIDRLECIDGVTVVIACRTFDLEYDPLLKGRSWQHKVALKPLDFESVVSPFLRNWGINPNEINTELRELLQLPQNLHLYEKLAKLRPGLQPTSAYELCNSFLEEVVVKNPQLGNEALIALQSMANYLLQERIQSCSKAAFRASEDIVRQLISQEVLLEPKTSLGVLKFSHQTLADCLIVRANLNDNKTLAWLTDKS